MRRRLLAALVCLALVPTAAFARADAGAPEPSDEQGNNGAPAPSNDKGNNGITVDIAADAITMANGLVERRWTTAPFGTASITDTRTGLTTGASPDFRLRLVDGAELTGKDFTVANATADELPRGGRQLVLTLAGAGGTVTRTIAMYPGVAGFEVRTTVALPALALTGYTLDEVTLPGAAPTLHAFSAGYDWRGSDTQDWEPTVAPFGGAHTGDHRETRSTGPGEALAGEGQWLSLDTADGQAFQVLERVNYASSRGAYDGTKGATNVDLNRDLIYLGPLESDGHFANPDRFPLRQRFATPVEPLVLEPVFTGFALDADDEPWQYAKYVERFRAPRWDRGGITFNSNGVDDDRISTGAKDDMNFEEVQRQAAVAQRLGVDTFILDDGWQAISGDWCPDSPECPEPRNGDDAKFAPRFPDSDFTAVREAIGDMKLGLWMNPMHFHPASEMAKRNPGWICQPVGTATAAANAAQPDSSSNEAGIGQWNPEGLGQDGKLIDFIEGRIRHAITEWDVSYFKFDFLAWLDCGGAEPVTMYEYRESFLRMLDRLIADHPTVTFQIDETNDYRLFPFESATRGPSWYANGNPKTSEALHNLWVLAPYVPGYTIGQSTLADRKAHSTDYVMAVALGSHLSYFNDLTTYSEEQVSTAGKWAEIYRANRDRFAQFTYPLLSDPLAGDNWTALQPWDADEQRGALMVYRQDAPAETETVALRGVRGDGQYRLTDAATGAVFGEFSADELRAGIPVTLPQRSSAKVLLIDRI